MTLTITFEGVILTILALLGMIFLVYLILLLKKLIETLKQVDEIMKDAQVVTSVAANQAQKVDGVMDNVGTVVGTISEAVRGNKSVVAAGTSVINAITSTAGMMKHTEKKNNK